MKSILIIFFFVSIGHTSFCQQQYYKQINEQVWIPFLKAFNEGDNRALSNVHSKDFARVIRDDQKIFGFEEAFKELPKETKAESMKWNRTLTLRFIERIASDVQAFEVGYYRTYYKNSNTGEEQTSYGKFHVLLRKEEEIWKVVMDADGSLGVDESVFQTGRKMEEWVD